MMWAMAGSCKGLPDGSPQLGSNWRRIDEPDPRSRLYQGMYPGARDEPAHPSIRRPGPPPPRRFSQGDRPRPGGGRAPGGGRGPAGLGGRPGEGRSRAARRRARVARPGDSQPRAQPAPSGRPARRPGAPRRATRARGPAGCAPGGTRAAARGGRGTGRPWRSAGADALPALLRWPLAARDRAASGCLAGDREDPAAAGARADARRARSQARRRQEGVVPGTRVPGRAGRSPVGSRCDGTCDAALRCDRSGWSGGHAGDRGGPVDLVGGRRGAAGERIRRAGRDGAQGRARGGCERVGLGYAGRSTRWSGPGRDRAGASRPRCRRPRGPRARSRGGRVRTSAPGSGRPAHVPSGDRPGAGAGGVGSRRGRLAGPRAARQRARRPLRARLRAPSGPEVLRARLADAGSRTGLVVLDRPGDGAGAGPRRPGAGTGMRADRARRGRGGECPHGRLVGVGRSRGPCPGGGPLLATPPRPPRRWGGAFRGSSRGSGRGRSQLPTRGEDREPLPGCGS